MTEGRKINIIGSTHTHTHARYLKVVTFNGFFSTKIESSSFKIQLICAISWWISDCFWILNQWEDVLDVPAERLAIQSLLDGQPFTDVTVIAVFCVTNCAVIESNVVVKPNFSNAVGVPSIATFARWKLQVR